MTLVKVYFIKKSRRSSSEDEKERTTIKISVLSLFPYPLYFLLLHVINWIIARKISRVDLSCFSLKINLIHWIRFHIIWWDQLIAKSIQFFNYTCIVFWFDSLVILFIQVWFEIVISFVHCTRLIKVWLYNKICIVNLSILRLFTYICLFDSLFVIVRWKIYWVRWREVKTKDYTKM